MLTSAEQDDLYIVIVSFLGDDPSIKQYKDTFSELTIKVVEDMFSSDTNCNKAMKEFIVSLPLGILMPKNFWLKVSLKVFSRALKSKKIHTIACKNIIKSRWKSSIISSAI